MRGDLEKLAYEAALRGLDKQEKLLEELRARTGVLLAAASLALSLLGRQAFERPDPRILAMLALASFAVAVLASVFVLIPRGNLYFSMRAASLLEGAGGLGVDAASLHQQLAHDLNRYWSTNSEKIKTLTLVYTLGALALVVEIFSMLILAGGILL